MAGVIAFAPQGYVIENTKAGYFQFQGIPDGLAERLKTALKIYTLSLGQGDNYFCSWRRSDNKFSMSYNLSHYPLLREYIENEQIEERFKYIAFQCSLGPDQTFYFNNSGTGQRFFVKDNALTEEIKSRIQSSKWVGDPTQVSLGIEQSWVLLGKKGDLLWDMKGHYVALDKILQEATVGVQSITLSSFSGDDWYVLFKDNTVRWGCKDPNWDLRRKAR